MENQLLQPDSSKTEACSQEKHIECLAVLTSPDGAAVGPEVHSGYAEVVDPTGATVEPVQSEVDKHTDPSLTPEQRRDLYINTFKGMHDNLKRLHEVFAEIAQATVSVAKQIDLKIPLEAQSTGERQFEETEKQIRRLMKDHTSPVSHRVKMSEYLIALMERVYVDMWATIGTTEIMLKCLEHSTPESFEGKTA